MSIDRWLAVLPLRLRAIFRPAQMDAELDEELHGHLERLTESNLRAGMSAADAALAAQRAMRGLQQTREHCRDARHVSFLGEAAQDVRFAGRVLRRSPLFTAIAALTLTLGIGINVTMFTVVDAIAFRSVPFDQPEQLVRVFKMKDGSLAGDPAALDVRDVAAASHTLSHLVVFDQWRKNVVLPGATERPEEMVVGLVPPEYFELLGLRPILGRAFTDDENRAGNNFVAAISNALWRDRFGASRDVLGRVVRINDEPYTIVAVMPDAVPAWLEARHTPTPLWTPFASPTSTTWLESSRGRGGYQAIGRMRPGVSLTETRAELNQLAVRLGQMHPADRPYGLTAVPLADTRAGALRPVLIMLSVAVAAVLLIACANLANLLLARNAARQRELQLRMALGASRARLCRQLLVETVTLSLIGGLGGLLFSFAGAAAVERWHSPALPQLADLPMDGPVLAFSILISLLTGLVFGLGPAWTTSRVDLATALRAGGRSGTGARAEVRVRAALVIAEVALALTLVTATALLTRSATNLQRQDVGFPTDHLMKAHIFIPPARYPDAVAVARFADRFGDAVRALPGVQHATVTVGYPPSGARWLWPLSIEGQPPGRPGEMPTTNLGLADRWFLTTFGIPVLRGRDFSASDAPDAAPVGIVNETFARHFFGNGNPLGARVRVGDPESSPRAITIVGVFRDVKNDGLANPPLPQLIGLHTQLPEFKVEFKDVVVRTAGESTRLVTPIRRALADLDPNMPLAEEMGFDRVIALAAAERPYVAILLGLFALLGLALAAVGIYGVVAYGVTQRRAEFGIRSALGATPVRLLWLVVRNGLALGICGAAVGLLLSVAASRLIAGQLFGVSALDPLTLGMTAGTLMLVAALASFFPALTATTIDPIRALRGD